MWSLAFVDTDMITVSLAVMGVLLVYHQQEAASVCSKYMYVHTYIGG